MRASSSPRLEDSTIGTIALLRLEWRMRVQIDVPEFDTRAVLRKKAEVERIEASARRGGLPPTRPGHGGRRTRS